MRIPEHLVEQVRQQSDIVEVVGEVVPLRQRGRNYIGLCPFHGEKTPSFNVSPDRGIYKCFGCGKGGNVFSFLMEYHKMSFVEAIRTLADRVGVALPDEEEDDDEKKDGYSRYDTAYALLRAAANFYYKQLLSPVGKVAADYIRRRGFQEETIKEFGLGYSPDDWQSLLNEMQKQGFSDEAFVDTGLAVTRESGGMYDRFRGRLMFPIQNPMGRVIGFGARLLNNQEKAAKYMNSPQSLVYDKSKVLYGIFQAKDAIRRENIALLVEGYADLLTMYQAGFRNVVASSGTALTREQLQLVGRYSKNLLIVYDGDFAGANAALRGLELSIEEGFDVKVARLPEGEDPDSLIHSRGAQAMERVLGDAVSFIDFKGDAFKAQGLLSTPEGQTEVVRSLVETISKVPDHIKRDFMIRAVALRFELNEHLLYAELSQILQKRSLSVRTAIPARRTEPVRERAEPKPGESDTRVQVAGETAPESEKPDEATEYNRLMGELLIEERELIRIMLEEPKSILFMRQKFGVNVDSFVSEVGRQLCSLVFRVAEQYRNIDQMIISRVTGEGNEWEQVYTMILSDIMLRREMPSERWKDFGVSLQEEPLKVIEDCLCRLLIRQKMLEQQAIEVQLKQAAPELELELLREYSRIRAEMDEIRERGVPHL